jgi:2-C-methyl-D-erythritol 4-phosphate cytidylyltransferase
VSVAAIVTAAGRGARMGTGEPKALLLLEGEPLLIHAVRAMAAGHGVTFVMVVAPADSVDDVRALLAVDARLVASGVVVDVVAGGRTRQESVALGVAALPKAVDVVLVHDAARPLVPVEVVDAVVTAVGRGADAVIPVLDVADTIRSVDDEGALGDVVDRSRLRTVQTPQGFVRSALDQAHAAYAADAHDESTAATDDASLVERWGGTVVAVPGSQEAFKVTRPFDLAVAHALLAQRRAATDGA